MKKSRFSPTPIVVLVLICYTIGLLLSVVNHFTAPVIEETKKAREEAALREVLPGGKDFKEIDIDSVDGLPETLSAAYKADAGYVFKVTERGYQPGLVIMCGINNDGKIVGVKCTESSETNGVEYTLADRFIGKEISDMSVDIVAGPTSQMTAKAYYRAVEAALLSYTVLTGGRTPEQKLQDSCNDALGTSGLVYEKLATAEDYDGVSAIYVSDISNGMVMLIGETYVGITPDGTITSEVSDDIRQIASAAYEAYVTAGTVSVEKPASSDPELNAMIESDVISIQKNNFGTYTIELTTKGVAADPNYGHYYQPITIRISIDADGKIVNCTTVSQGESEGYGDVCGTDDYCNAFIGAGADDIPDDPYEEGPGFISGATYTTTGYRNGVKLAFAVFELLKDEIVSVDKPISSDTELNAKIESDIISIQKDKYGTYTIELTTKGVAADPNYGHYYQPITIRVSIDADGKIVECITVFQGESEGYGDVCGTDDYCNAFIGAGADDIPDDPYEEGPGFISGATYTTTGYRNGVKLAFAVFELLTGGAS